VSAHVTWAPGGGQHEVAGLLDALQAEPRDHVAGVVVAGDFNATADEPHLREVVAAGYTDVARQAAASPEGFPTAMPQRWQGLKPAKASRSGPLLTSRIDYHFLRPTPAARPLRPLACVPVFNGRCAGDVYQPLVSDHIGLLGVYRT